MSKKIAFLVSNYFEEAEYAKVNSLLISKGYQTALITTQDDKELQSMKGDVDKVSTFTADKFLSEATVSDYDALILPGGTVNADTIRVDELAQNFVKDFYMADKPVAAICHAPWLLINSGLIKGKTVTAYHSLKTDIQNAGGNFVNEKFQRDGTIITSRKPDDIEDFVSAIDESLS